LIYHGTPLPDDFVMERDLDPRHFGMWRQLVELPAWLVERGFLSLPCACGFYLGIDAAAAAAYEAGVVAPQELQPYLLEDAAAHYYHAILHFAEKHIHAWVSLPEELQARFRGVKEQLANVHGPEQGQVWMDVLPHLKHIARELQAHQTNPRATPRGSVGE
jgi:hypothetical protein